MMIIINYDDINIVIVEGAHESYNSTGASTCILPVSLVIISIV